MRALDVRGGSDLACGPMWVLVTRYAMYLNVLVFTRGTFDSGSHAYINYSPEPHSDFCLMWI